MIIEINNFVGLKFILLNNLEINCLFNKIMWLMVRIIFGDNFQEFYILITDQFTSITDIAKKMTFQYSNN